MSEQAGLTGAREAEPAARTSVDVRPSTIDDLPGLTGVMARAFSNDPPMSWIFRDVTTRVQRLETLFGGALVEIFHPAGHLWAAADLTGCAVWQPPGRWRTPDEVVERVTPPLAEGVLPEELDRFLTFIGMIEDKHVDEPEHWYLEVLAVDLAHQGRGIGSACMRPILERADTEGMPAYLESSNLRNVPLYERHGFRVADVLDLPEGGPSLWLMWREPRST